jgi:hypothetical protein
MMIRHIGSTALGMLAGSLLAGAAFAEPPRPLQQDAVATSLGNLDRAASDQHDRTGLTRVGQQKLALRDEAARLQAADGGALTPRHRTYLQNKLDRINGS